MAEPEPSELPPIADVPLSVVLLPGNGADDTAEIVRGWLAVLDGLDREYQLLLCGGEKTISHDRLRVLRPSDPGVGAALRAGVAAAQHPLVCWAPCDRRYAPELLKAFLERIDKVHLVVGARTGSRVPAMLRWLGWLYRWTLRIAFGVELEPLPGWLGGRQRFAQLVLHVLFGLRLRDPACPMQLVRRAVLARVPLQSEGRFVHVEVLAKANFLGCMMDEAPIDWPEASVPERLRPMRADLRRLLKQPDFGPAPRPA
jgi:hypothetical protein